MTNRTKSLLFDDDVFDAFIAAHPWRLTTINEAIAMWQEGKVTASVTRRFISQHIAALTVVNRRDGGITPEKLVQVLDHLAKTYPALYAEDGEGPSKPN